MQKLLPERQPKDRDFMPLAGRYAREGKLDKVYMWRKGGVNTVEFGAEQVLSEDW